MNNQNYLQSKLNAEKFGPAFTLATILIVLGALATGLIVFFNINKGVEPLKMFLMLLIPVLLLILGIFFLLHMLSVKRNITKRRFFKTHQKQFNLNTAEDFHKLDAMVTEDLNTGIRYRHPAFGTGSGAAITNRFVILNFEAQPIVMDASKILLVACATRTVQTSRYSSVTYYDLNFYGADDRQSLTMSNELDQQEGGMKMAISLGILFSPDNRPFEKIYKKDRSRFISEALREARILYNPATLSPMGDANAQTQMLEPIPDFTQTQPVEQASPAYRPNLQTDIDSPL